MRRKIFTFLLSGLMMFALAIRLTQAQSSPDETLRNRGVEWEPNKVVKIQLKSGEKLQGRLAEITDVYFAGPPTKSRTATSTNSPAKTAVKWAKLSATVSWVRWQVSVCSCWWCGRFGRIIDLARLPYA